MQSPGPIEALLVLSFGGPDGPEQVMQLVEERAPNGFNVVTEVMTQQELEDVANTYKRVAGFQVEALNAKPPIVPRSAA